MLFKPIIQVCCKFWSKSVNPVEQAAYNNDVRYAVLMFFRTSLQVHSW
jgi:hypothetical protein